MLRKVLVFCLLAVFSSLTTLGQCMLVPVSLADRIKAADVIVLGKVREQKAFAAGTKKIFTANRVAVTAFLKGYSSESELVIVTEGGILNGRAQIVTPSLELQIGKEGLFMLQTGKFEGNPFNNLNAYLPYASVQGALIEEGGKYIDVMFDGAFTEKALLDQFLQFTGVKAKNARGELYSSSLVPEQQNQNLRTEAAGITSVSPNPVAAGTIESSNILSIKGSGFGTSRGRVEFSNADDGGRTYIRSAIPKTDIVSWSDTEIRIKVPNKAGTGTVRVNGIYLAPLTVKYNIVSQNSTFYNYPDTTRQKISLVNKNAKGGYTFYLSDDFALNEAAVTAFERTMQNWRCATGINFRIAGELASETGSASDNKCVVYFDQSLPAGVLGQTTSFHVAKGSSLCSASKTVWYTDEIDMAFTTATNWNFGPGASLIGSRTYDFESVALHELGHALGLDHIIDNNKVMHYALNNGTDRRTLSDVDIEGGTYKVTQSTGALCLLPENVSSPLKPVAQSQCTLPAELVSFQGSYDQYKGNVLSWKTEFEYKTLGYSIWKSKNGIQFDSIYFEPSQSQGIALNSYTNIDVLNQDANNFYYQLHQLRSDGTVRFSEIVNIKVPTDPEFIVYPTELTQPELTIVPRNIPTGNVVFKLFDEAGKNILSKDLELVTPGKRLYVNIPVLQWGMYIYQVTGANDTRSTGKIFVNFK